MVNYFVSLAEYEPWETCRHTTAGWSVFCSCSGSQSHVQTKNLKFPLEDSELPAFGSCSQKKSPLSCVPLAFHLFPFLGFYLNPILSFSSFI